MEPEHQHQQQPVRIHHTGGGVATGHSLANYYPLIAVAMVVAVLTGVGVTYFAQDPMLAFMGYFFLVFGGLKVIRLNGFVEAYQEYDLVAKRSRFYAYLYPFLELGFAATYLLAWQVAAVSVVVLVVMLVSALGVYAKLRQKEEVPCACLGTVFTLPMTWVTLGEDTLMAAMALMILAGW